MSELILHHFDISFYAEKVRAILGFKGLALDRIENFGHGTRSEMTAADAVRIAREARPTAESAVDPGEPTGRRVGDRIQLFPEAYGRDPVEGELVRADAHSVAIRRRDNRVGEVVVHFPREGTVILPA